MYGEQKSCVQNQLGTCISAFLSAWPRHRWRLLTVLFPRTCIVCIHSQNYFYAENYISCSNWKILNVYSYIQWRSQTRAHPGLGPGVSVSRKLSWTSYFCSIAICNDAVSCGLLIHCSHVWRLILVRTCTARRSHGSELLPIQDRRYYKSSLIKPPPTK